VRRSLPVKAKALWQNEDWENNRCIKLAYLPAPGRVRLRLSARGTDKEKLETTLKSVNLKLSFMISS
jgi:nicotinamide-nucleotide amidase